MHLVNYLIGLLKLQREQSHQLAELSRQNHALHKEFEELEREIKKGDNSHIEKLLKQIAREIHAIYLELVPEPVAKITLETETGETHVDISVGQTSTLTFQALGASGNPTVPVGAPSWNSTNSSDFSLDTNAGVLSLSPSAAAGATTDVTVVEDGVTSNVVSYTVVVIGPPPPEPVASVVLTGTTPA